MPMSEVAEAPVLAEPQPDPVAVAAAFAEYAGMTEGLAIAEGDWAGYVFSGSPILRAAKAKACQNRAKHGSKNRACRGAMSLYKLLQLLGEKPPDPKGVWVPDAEFSEAFGRARELYIEAKEEKLDVRAFDGWEVSKRARKDPNGRGYIYEKQRVYDSPEVAKMRMAKLDPAGYAARPTVSITDNSQRNSVGLNLPENFDVSAVVKNIMGITRYRALTTVETKALPVNANE